MPLSYKVLVSGASLSGSAASVYTALALTSATISAVSVNNPTGAPVTFELYLGSAATNNTKIVTKSIPAGKSVPVSEVVGHKIEAGMQLFALGAGMFLNISGSEYVQ
ncbi:hypothetical protein MNJPNG_04985 [Cupriavidus oxalaticus]|uniref:hypothetical protein n=1 Tax=Cupriavidus oxalaticus TaxID=96344 RepID=UPI003F733556